MNRADQDYQQIILQKDIILEKKKEKNNDYYQFRLINNRLNIIEFIADFTESRGVELRESNLMKIDGSNSQEQIKDTYKQSKIQKTIIQPNGAEIVCLIKILDQSNWELKSKFKYIIKPAPKEKQKDTIKEHDEEKKRVREEEGLAQKLKTLPLSILTTGECLYHIKLNLERERKNNFSKYIDPYFLPIDDSIFGVNDGSAFDTLIQWRRPEKIFENSKEIRVFPSKINFCDIIPGQLSNYWFLSSVALLAEKQECIKRLFLTQDVNEQGFYRVKICKNGEWQTVNVDDYFPCYPLDGPIFSHIDSQQEEDQSDISKSSSSNCHQIWLLILEKAYAKIHGDYFKLKNGSQKKCENALIDLTGCPVTKIKLDPYTSIKDIQMYYDKGYLMNLQTEDKQKDATGYAYSIIGIREYYGNILFNIRDIWENLQWKGDWSRESGLWDDPARKYLNPNLNDPKQTWMKFENVKDKFKFLNVCKIQDWNEVRIKGKFVKVVDTNDSSIETFMSKWYYQFEITETCLQKAKNNIEVIITLHQEDELIKGVEDGRPYLDVQLALFQLVNRRKGNQNDNDSKKKAGSDNDYYRKLHHTKFSLKKISDPSFQHERQIELSVNIQEKGIYIILPRTNGLGFRESKKSKIKNFIQKKNDKQSHQKGQSQESKAENLRFDQLLESTLHDIFRKFDMRLTRKMSQQQFVAFKYCFEDEQPNEENEREFKKEFQDLLEEYPSPDECLSQEGFMLYMKEKIQNDQDQNTPNFLQKFSKIGYDESLYSIRSRCFIISLHSDIPLDVIVRDAIETDLDQRAARHVYQNIPKDRDQIIATDKEGIFQGEDLTKVQPYVYAQYFKEANYTTFIAKNQKRDKAIEVIFDLQKTRDNIILSTGRSNLKKKVEFKTEKIKEMKDPQQTIQKSQTEKMLSKNSDNISIEVLFHMRGPYKQDLETFRRICQIKECED